MSVIEPSALIAKSYVRSSSNSKFWNDVIPETQLSFDVDDTVYTGMNEVESVKSDTSPIVRWSVP